MSAVTNIGIFTVHSCKYLGVLYNSVYFILPFYKQRNWCKSYVWLNAKMEWKIKIWSVHFCSLLILLMWKNSSQQGIWLGLKRQKALEKLESVIRCVSYPPSIFRWCLPGQLYFVLVPRRLDTSGVRIPFTEQSTLIVWPVEKPNWVMILQCIHMNLREELLFLYLQ